MQSIVCFVYSQKKTKLRIWIHFHKVLAHENSTLDLSWNLFIKFEKVLSLFEQSIITFYPRDNTTQFCFKTELKTFLERRLISSVHTSFNWFSTTIEWGWAWYEELSSRSLLLSTKAEGWVLLILHNIMWKPNLIIVLSFI